MKAFVVSGPDFSIPQANIHAALVARAKREGRISRHGCPAIDLGERWLNLRYADSDASGALKTTSEGRGDAR